MDLSTMDIDSALIFSYIEFVETKRMERKQMVKQKTVKSAVVAGHTFQGETVAGAKSYGESQITRYVTESKFGPSMFRVHAPAQTDGPAFLEVLVWPEIEGWAYRVLDSSPHQSSGRFGFIHPNCNFQAASRGEACLDAVFVAAQRLWNVSVTDDETYIVHAFGPLIETQGAYLKVAEFKSHCGWQRRYAAAYAICADKNMAWDNAGRTDSVEACERLCLKEIGRVKVGVS